MKIRQSRQRKCLKCYSGCKVTSAYDGRTKWICTKCSFEWTEGRKLHKE